MTHRIKNVITRDNLILQVTFQGGEVKQYDVKQLCVCYQQFKELQMSEELFNNVRVDHGGYGIYWNDNLDLDAETIWEDGVFVEWQQETDLNHLLAYRLMLARESVAMTQKELAEKTGIYQADISKIERGIGNPSLNTLKRLADGLGMVLSIDFILNNK